MLNFRDPAGPGPINIFAEFVVISESGLNGFDLGSRPEVVCVVLVVQVPDLERAVRPTRPQDFPSASQHVHLTI